MDISGRGVVVNPFIYLLARLGFFYAHPPAVILFGFALLHPTKGIFPVSSESLRTAARSDLHQM